MASFFVNINEIMLDGQSFSGFCRPSRLQLLTVLFFFRSNQIFAAFLLALYVLLVHFGALSGAVQPLCNSIEGGLLYQSLFGWANGSPFYSALAATFLGFAQAVVVNVLADEFRLMGERNWFPGLFYALAVSALPEFLFISAPLVAITFIPFSLWRIYNAYQKPHVTGLVFDSALWIAVASLFYPPALWLLVAAFSGLGVVRVFRLKERLVFVVGAFVPLFLFWLWYFWADRGAAFRDSQWGGLFQLYRFDAVLDDKTLMKTAFLILLALVLIQGVSSLYSRKGIQSQKFASVLYWFLGIGSLTVLLRPEWRWEQLLLPAPVMGILISLTFQSIRNKAWADFSHLCLLGFVLMVQFADWFLNLIKPLF